MDLSDDSLYVDAFCTWVFLAFLLRNFLMQKDVFFFQALNSAEVLQSWLRPSTFKRGSAIQGFLWEPNKPRQEEAIGHAYARSCLGGIEWRRGISHGENPRGPNSMAFSVAFSPIELGKDEPHIFLSCIS